MATLSEPQQRALDLLLGAQDHMGLVDRVTTSFSSTTPLINAVAARSLVELGLAEYHGGVHVKLTRRALKRRSRPTFRCPGCCCEVATKETFCGECACEDDCAPD